MSIAAELVATMALPAEADVKLWVSDGGMTSEKLRGMLDGGAWFRLTAARFARARSPGRISRLSSGATRHIRANRYPASRPSSGKP